MERKSYDSCGLRQTMLSMPLAYPSTLDRAATGCARAMMVVLRGGALEPDPYAFLGKPHAKAHAISQRDFQADAQRIFLSQAGPQFLRWLLKLGITLLSRNLDSPPK